MSRPRPERDGPDPLRLLVRQRPMGHRIPHRHRRLVRRPQRTSRRGRRMVPPRSRPPRVHRCRRTLPHRARRKHRTIPVRHQVLGPAGRREGHLRGRVLGPELPRHRQNRSDFGHPQATLGRLGSDPLTAPPACNRVSALRCESVGASARFQGSEERGTVQGVPGWLSQPSPASRQVSDASWCQDRQDG